MVRARVSKKSGKFNLLFAHSTQGINIVDMKIIFDWLIENQNHEK